MAHRRDRPRATYEDLRQIPETMVGEILDGELVATPRPRPLHAHAASVLGMDLGSAFHRDGSGPKGPGGWWILDEPELHLHGDALLPDVAGWRRERLPRLPAGAAFTVAPDWVCEIVSPATARFDRSRKMPIYAKCGVPHFWMVDPQARTLEVFRLEGERWTLLAVHGEWAETIRVEPFEAIEFDLGRLWVETETSPQDR